jgi:hypothetical protein
MPGNPLRLYYQALLEIIKVATLIASGTVIMYNIGQSAGKVPKTVMLGNGTPSTITGLSVLDV